MNQEFQKTEKEMAANAVLLKHLAMVELLSDADKRLTMINGKQLADFLMVSVKKIEADRCSGRGVPFIKLSSGVVRYRVVDIIDFIEKRHCLNTCKVGVK